VAGGVNGAGELVPPSAAHDDVKNLIDALRRRPRRGGIRLTVEQAELALRMIHYGGSAVRVLRKQTRHERLLEASGGDEEHVRRVEQVLGE